jgi:hypothetical protein
MLSIGGIMAGAWRQRPLAGRIAPKRRSATAFVVMLLVSLI